MRPCPTWMPSETMDEDDAALSQNALSLRGKEWTAGVVLQIAPVLASAFALREQCDSLPVNLRHRC
jgi:hypothetical protein